MSDIEQAWEIMARLNARGFVVNLSIDRDGCQRVWAMAGDCNCPHRKLYDQTDGHGFTHLDSEDWDEWFSSESEFTVLATMQMLERKINEAYAKQSKPP